MRAEQTEPSSNADQCIQHVKNITTRCTTCRHFKQEHHSLMEDGHFHSYMECMASECNYEPILDPSLLEPIGEECVGVTGWIRDDALTDQTERSE